MNSESGNDDKGKFFKNIQALWDSQLRDSKEKWYSLGDQYWRKIEPTLKGVLGGLDFLNKIDIEESNKLLTMLYKNPLQDLRVLDCGAGIGRVSKELLIQWFKKVDLVEQNPIYVEKAKEELGDKISEYYCAGLQSFEFQHKYDCIWVQWVASHLTDDDLILFLKKCKLNLNGNGYIILKENITKQGFSYDTEDHSVIRSDAMFKQIFQKAGLDLKFSGLQPNFPKDLYLVNQYVLQ
ncbi:unnamed protein product [Paramecium octaurelia]|uniref:Uncharacterized protein n=1 Tax=Paramecium octaurelia TaxID=43137 RepID=A0A8S1WRI6_PAROT|nr:unnamed protein product [Paramecium octaurelia]